MQRSKNVKCYHPHIKTLNKGEIYIFNINDKKIKTKFLFKETNYDSLAYPDKCLNFKILNDDNNNLNGFFHNYLWVNITLTFDIKFEITEVCKYISFKDKLDLL